MLFQQSIRSIQTTSDKDTSSTLSTVYVDRKFEIASRPHKAEKVQLQKSSAKKQPNNKLKELINEPISNDSQPFYHTVDGAIDTLNNNDNNRHNSLPLHHTNHSSGNRGLKRVVSVPIDMKAPPPPPPPPPGVLEEPAIKPSDVTKAKGNLPLGKSHFLYFTIVKIFIL